MSTPNQISPRLLLAIVLGILLNPLNSSMIAVALVRLRHEFDVSPATVTWLISGFYLAASVGQPLMGRFVDRFGARRVFLAGLLLVAITGGLAPLSPSFGWLVAARALQAFGTSTAFPAGMAMIRRAAGDPNARPPAQALGIVALAASVSAAAGPVLGGVLVSAAGWEAIFFVNAPMAALGIVLGLRWFPPDGERETGTIGELVRSSDLPGILLFAGAMTTLLAFLLSVGTGPTWPMLPAAIVFGSGLIWWERRAATPFLDVRMLAANPRLLAVYGQFAGTCLVFYGAFYALPQWLEQARGFEPNQTGLLVLPIAAVGACVTPFAARFIDRVGTRPPLIIGSILLCVASLCLLLFGPGTAVVVIVVICAVLGLPNSLNNLALQARLYLAAPTAHTGAAAGLFQTSRYVGAIGSTCLLGLLFTGSVGSAELHRVAIVNAGVALLLVLASLRRVASSSA